MGGRALLDHFSALADPGQAWKAAYPLPELLLLVLCGTLAGAQNFVEIEDWGSCKLPFLRRLLPFARGIPSHDTLTDVMNALPATTFSACFTSWAERLRESEPDIVAIDGKTSRRAGRGAAHPLHLVSAWVSRQRIVLGQEAVACKGDEITAIPLLLERLELTGALVTLDAMGCQRDIARAIRAKGGDYLLALEDKWPTLAEEVRLFFDTAPPSAFDTHQTTDGDHGHIEVRRHRVTRDVAWLTIDRRFPGEPRFPDLAAVGMALSSRLGRGYPCVRNPVGCPALHHVSQQTRQGRERAQRRARLRRRTHRATKRGVQHPDREFLNPHRGYIHEPAACRRGRRPQDHLMQSDRLSRPGMPRIGDRGLTADRCTVSLVEGNRTVITGPIEPSTTAPQPSISQPSAADIPRLISTDLGHVLAKPPTTPYASSRGRSSERYCHPPAHARS